MKIGFPVFCFGLSLCISSCDAPVGTAFNTASVLDPFILVATPNSIDSAYRYYAKDLQTGDSIWFMTLKRGDSQVPGPIAGFLQHVVTGNFEGAKRDSSGLFASGFKVRSLLRDTLLPQNPLLDSLDSLLVPGKAIGDFAPIRIGNSWTYRDSIETCPGLLRCTSTVESVTVAIQDIFVRNDTTFFRLSEGRKYASTLCFEKGNAFYNISALTDATAALGCPPLLYHEYVYSDSVSDRLSKMDTLGRSTWILTTADTLHFSPSMKNFPQEVVRGSSASSNLSDFRLARGLGVLSYRYYGIVGLSSPTSTAVYSTLIGADLH